MPPDQAQTSDAEEKLCWFGLVLELWSPSRTVDTLHPEVPRLGPPHTPCPRPSPRPLPAHDRPGCCVSVILASVWESAFETLELYAENQPAGC